MSFSRVKKLLAYIVTPAVFCVAGYLLLWFALQPIWGMASAAVGFLVSDDAPNFNPELRSIYDPNALKEATQKKDTDASASSGNPNTPTVDPNAPIPGDQVEFPYSETQYGQLVCDEIGLNSPVYWYDSDDILAYGVGTSMVGKLPGFGRMILLAGHNLTDFACFEFVQPGNVIQFHTNYDNYEYTVTNVQVINETDLEHMVLQKVDEPREELIMYTCYPFHAIEGRKTDRLVVFADRTAGRDVDWREE